MAVMFRNAFRSEGVQEAVIARMRMSEKVLRIWQVCCVSEFVTNVKRNHV